MRFASMLLAGVLMSAKVFAGTLDGEGVFVKDPKATSLIGFEEAGLVGADGLAIDGIREDSTSLEGKRSLLLGDARIRIPVGNVRSGGRIATTLYARGGALGGLLVSMCDEEVVRAVPLYPTGTTTTDGWVEYASSGLSLSEPCVTRTFVSLARASEAPVYIDAIEVRSLAEGELPKRCGDGSPCGAGESCETGVCRVAAEAFPAMPQGQEKEDFVAGFSEHLTLHAGGLAMRTTNLPFALAELEKLRDIQEPSVFWQTFAAAFQKLRDGHTGVYAGLANQKMLPVCFALGVADRIAGANEPPAVLATHAMPGGVWAPGDQLVSVDGFSPIEWVRSLVGRKSGPIDSSDPEAHGSKVEELSELIPRFGKEITIVSCANGTCASPKTIAVRDLPTVASRRLTCDHRPGFHIEDATIDPALHNLGDKVVHGRLAGTTANEKLYGVTWNSLFGNNQSELRDAFDLVRAEAKGVVLDHRRGDGGYFTWATEISRLFRPEAKLAVFGSTQSFQWVTPFTDRAGRQVFSGLETVSPFVVGSSSARNDLRTALLVARSGSASDALAFALKGQPNVRVFGLRTEGMFTSVIDFSYAGYLSWSLGTGEFFDPGGRGLSGHGVVPDEEVLPKQSDLMAGKDTAYERALAWVREGRK